MFTNVNSYVNKTVNSRLQYNSQKTVDSVNRPNALENIGKMRVKEMLAIQLCMNTERVIE